MNSLNGCAKCLRIDSPLPALSSYLPVLLIITKDDRARLYIIIYTFLLGCCRQSSARFFCL